MTKDTGMRALTAEEFHPLSAVGGWRGLIETMLPGTLFVVVFVATRELAPSVIASGGVAILAVLARLVQRTPVTQAFSGIFGVAIGIIWAWRTGNAQDYYVWGFITNAAYLVPILISIAVRWPIVGIIVEGLKAGFADAKKIESGATKGWSVWRKDPALMRKYQVASWLWVGLFGVRLAVQLPLYFAGEVGWLGTARLAMGLPLWAATLWLTWVMVRSPRPALPEIDLALGDAHEHEHSDVAPADSGQESARGGGAAAAGQASSDGDPAAGQASSNGDPTASQASSASSESPTTRSERNAD